MLTGATNTVDTRLYETLMPIFNAKPWFFADDPQLLDWLRSNGFEAHKFGESSIRDAPEESIENAVLLPSKDTTVTYKLLDEVFRNSKVLLVPLYAFDNSYEAAVYTVEMMSVSNFVTATDTNRRMVKILETSKEPLIFQGEGCSLNCELDDRVNLLYPKMEAELLPGEWASPASWLETALIPDYEDIYSPGYNVNGEYVAYGAAVAFFRQAPPAVEKMHREAWALMKRLHLENQFPLHMIVENSHVKRVATRGGSDITSKLLELSNAKLEMLLVEVALSGNSGISPEQIDWKENSVMNEGSQGMHLAIGDGLTGAHIDLIAPGVTLLD